LASDKRQAFTEAAATILRIALGLVFIAHAWGKLSRMGIAGTQQFFEAVGFWGWTAYPVFLIEFGGGALLIAGVYTRLAALALLPVTLAAMSVHIPNGWNFTARGGGWEYPAFLCVSLAASALLGDGALALRRRIRRVVPQEMRPQQVRADTGP
jgi:putative oxidoreductase